MTRPTSRVLALLEVLQAGGTRTVGDLAGRLGVDERTVRRYVGHLVELDIPVESVRGRHGGYRLAPGYRMPPMMLTNDEAVALMLGLEVGRRVGLITGSAAADSASAKLQRVLPARLSQRLKALLATSSFTTPQRSATPSETDTLLVLAEAAFERRPLGITYTSRDGLQSDRVIHPYGLVAHSGRWYVAAADAGAGEKRTFRVDRIRSTTPLPGSFDVPEGTESAATVLQTLAETPWRHTVSLRVRGTAEQVRRRLPLGIASVHPSDPESPWVHVSIRAERLDWLPALLAGMDRSFTIEEPAELRNLVHAFARRLHAFADETADT